MPHVVGAERSNGGTKWRDGALFSSVPHLFQSRNVRQPVPRVDIFATPDIRSRRFRRAERRTHVNRFGVHRADELCLGVGLKERTDFRRRVGFRLLPFGVGLRHARMEWSVQGYLNEVSSSEAVFRVSHQRGKRMTTPTIVSLDKVTLKEALAYIDAADGDEIIAAFELATDRNRLDGSSAVPDDAEVHHALFLLRKARGLEAPSFDSMRIQLRERLAA